MITQDGKRFTHKMLLLNRPEPLRTEALGNSTCFLISSVFGGSQKTKRNESIYQVDIYAREKQGIP